MMKQSTEESLASVKKKFGDDMYMYLLEGYNEKTLNDETDFMALAHDIADRKRHV